jgi:hypothetical protein
MHHRDLYITHRAFWKIEPRARFYDQYMKQKKNWKKWPDSVSLEEIRKLLEFIPKWDMHFRVKDPEKFAKIYYGILPTIRELQVERLENANLASVELTRKIKEIFDEVAPCSEEAYESTDCSKILHTILPHLIVMWDQKIRKGILGDENKKWGIVYASEFLPLMQAELKEALNTCIVDMRLRTEEAVKHISLACGYETLPKLIDEHNYVIYTKSIEFRAYLEGLKKKNEIHIEDYERLRRKITIY